MASIPRSAPSTATIRQELMATRQAFHNLLDAIPTGALDAPTSNPAWTVRDLLFHIVLAPEMLPVDIGMIRRGQSMSFPVDLFNVVNKYYTRWRARGLSPAEIGRQYDMAHQNVLALLDTLTPEELARTTLYPVVNTQLPGGETSLADMFQYMTRHFAEHAVDVLRGVDAWQRRPLIEQIGEAKPPGGWQRMMFRMPIWLYHNHLGWLLGGRFLLINHIGRKSGLPRQTVVEVTNHDRVHDSYTVASGWGAQADWYKNLRAHPQTTIQVGERRLAVEANLLSAEESGEEMVRYARRYPMVAKELVSILGYRLRGGEESYRAFGRQVVRFVRFEREAVERLRD